jgi:hypothetical protein
MDVPNTIVLVRLSSIEDVTSAAVAPLAALGGIDET